MYPPAEDDAMEGPANQPKLVEYPLIESDSEQESIIFGPKMIEYQPLIKPDSDQEEIGTLEPELIDYPPVALESDQEVIPPGSKAVESQAVIPDSDQDFLPAVETEPALPFGKEAFIPVENDGPAEGQPSARAQAVEPAAAPVGTQTAAPTAPAAASPAEQTSPAAQTQPDAAQPVTTKPNRFVLPSGIARILLILAAFVIMGASVYWFGSMLGLFPTVEAPCKCAQTDAYLLRVQDRVSRWLNNQALYLFAETHGDAPQNTEFAQKLYDEENKDSVPVCLKDLHETLLSTFDNHIKYGDAIKNKDTKLMGYYRGIEAAMQDTLKSEFQKLKGTLVCTP